MQVINLEIITSVSCGFNAFHNSTTHTACFQFLASFDGGSCRRSYHVLDLSRVKSFFNDHAQPVCKLLHEEVPVLHRRQPVLR